MKTPVFCLTAASDLLSTGISPAVKKEILQILHYVNKNYSEKISLEDLSEHVHLNKEYLCGLFKKETGKSLFQYINDFRIQKAAELLKSGNAVFKDLSNKVGFTNQYIFTKRFKEAHGCMPSEYVQNCKKEEKTRK